MGSMNQKYPKKLVPAPATMAVVLEPNKNPVVTNIAPTVAGTSSIIPAITSRVRQVQATLGLPAERVRTECLMHQTYATGLVALSMVLLSLACFPFARRDLAARLWQIPRNPSILAADNLSGWKLEDRRQGATKR